MTPNIKPILQSLQVRDLEDAVGVFHISPRTAIRPNEAEQLVALTDILNQKDAYEPVFLNDALPIDRKKRHDVIALLKRVGLSFKMILYCYGAGGNVGNFYFGWKINPQDDADTISTHVARLSSGILDTVPSYHTRQMRREFIHKFGLVSNMKTHT